MIGRLRLADPRVFCAPHWRGRDLVAIALLYVDIETLNGFHQAGFSATTSVYRPVQL